VDPVERLGAGEALEGLDAEAELARGKRALATQPALAQPVDAPLPQRRTADATGSITASRGTINLGGLRR
jgi:hypothetical protein